MCSSEIQSPLDAEAIRADFPVLGREARPGVPLVYLDNAATSQKPRPVIEAIEHFYSHYNANVHRGIHALSEEATIAYEGARDKIAAFINASSRKEVIFTRGTTEGINLVASTWGRANIGPGDVILTTQMEHHSNLVPWQLLAQEKGAELRFIPATQEGELDLSGLDDLLDGPVKIVAVMHVSNVLGTINPIKQIIDKAHQAGAVVLIDGAQSVPHMPIDVQELGMDFLAFSGHKMLGPTGIGVLYGRRELLEEMPPYMGGGDMIRRVELSHSEWNELPWKFEAGTPNIAGGIGLGVAVEYLSRIGMEKILAHEQELTAYALERLSEVPGLKVYGPPAEKKCGVASFCIEGLHPHDMAQLLDAEGVAVRAGHHCAQPLHMVLGAPATTRASFYLYNLPGEVDALIEAIYKAKARFSL